MAAGQAIASANDNRPSQEELRHLRDRVDDLEVKTQEARKPWYKQLPLWLSIASLIISSGFSLYTAVQQMKDKRAEDLQKRLENLRTTVLQIADIRNQFLQILATSDQQNVTQFNQQSALLNTKKQVLIENADSLLSGIEKDVSPAVFLELAYEESSDGRLVEAERYYKLGLQSNRLDVLSTVALNRSLGELYLQRQTNYYRPEIGRDYYRRALEVFKNQEDGFSLYNRVYVLCSWAYLEFQNRNTEAGTKLLQRGRAEALKISDDSPSRLLALNLVNWNEQFSHHAPKSKTTLPVISGVVGQWRMLYSDSPDISGVLAVVINPDGKTFSASVDAFKGDKLIRKYTGQVYASPSGMLTLEWTGIEATPLTTMPWTYVYGTTTLKLSEDGRLSGNEYALGQASRVVRFVRREN